MYSLMGTMQVLFEEALLSNLYDKSCHHFQTVAASMVVGLWFVVPAVTIVSMIGCLFFSDNLQWLPLAYISIIILEKHVPNQGGRKQM